MKKLAFVLAVLISLSMLPSFAEAAQVPLKVVVDGSKLNFPDAQPFIDSNGRTQTPVSFIGKALGATVTWDGKGKRALFVLDGKQLVLYIGKKEYTISGQKKQMDTGALLKAGRTFVPAKYVAEAYGATVKWDGSSKTVYITTNRVTKPILTSITNKFAVGKAKSDLAVVLTPNGNIFKGITGLTKGTDYTVSDNVVKISKNYLNSLTAGKKVLVFDFGIASNPVLTLTVTDTLGISVGTASGATGATVTVPVKLTNVAKAGSFGIYNFYLKYDTSVLKAESISIGNIVLSPDKFASIIDLTTGKIRFINSAIDSKVVTSDGVLATITFKVIGSSSVTTPITFDDTENIVFFDGSVEEITDFKLVDGSVKVN